MSQIPLWSTVNCSICSYDAAKVLAEIRNRSLVITCDSCGQYFVRHPGHGYTVLAGEEQAYELAVTDSPFRKEKP